jgi:purine-binding chemotaxis protein CheW
MDLKKNINMDSDFQAIIFSLAKEEFGLEITKIHEILKMVDITKIPNSPLMVRGVIDLRGEIIVIIDLRNKFGFEPKEDDKDTRIIILEIGQNVIGIVVDAVAETLRIPKDKIEQAPPLIAEKIHADYIKGVGVLDKRLIILIDINKVLGVDVEEINQLVKK